MAVSLRRPVGSRGGTSEWGRIGWGRMGWDWVGLPGEGLSVFCKLSAYYCPFRLINGLNKLINILKWF